jgi:hypothetical protein
MESQEPATKKIEEELPELDTTLNAIIQKYAIRIRSSIGVLLSYVKSHIWFLMVDKEGNVINEGLFEKFISLVEERGHTSMLNFKNEPSGPVLQDFLDAFEEVADQYTPEDLLGVIRSPDIPFTVRAVFGLGQGVVKHYVKNSKDIVYALAIKGDEGIEQISKNVSKEAYAMLHGRPKLLHLVTMAIFSVLDIPYLSEEEKVAFEAQYMQELKKAQKEQGLKEETQEASQGP